MKPYFVIGLDGEENPARQVGSWFRFLKDRSAASDILHPAIDEILAAHRLPVWITREYSHAIPGHWTPDEIASGLNNVYRVILREDREIPPSLIDNLRLLPFVRFARLGRVMGAVLPAAQSGRTRGSRTWRAADAMGLDEARAYTKGDRSVRVAVLDTGVWLKHHELRDCLDDGFDCVDLARGMDAEALKDFVGDYLDADPVPDDEWVGHGTHVAGIIGARGLDMPLGVAPECRIIPVRTLAAMKKGEQIIGAGLEENINYAIKWAVDRGAEIINMSLGVKHEGGGLPHEQVVDYARRKGVTIVAASGNDGRRELYYPGALPHVIAVGAADDEGNVAAFSTFGDQVTVIAPGTDIFSSFLKDRYAVASGTSQAAPFVTGAVALLKSFARKSGKALSDSQVKYLLKNTADKVGKSFKDLKAGFGHLNVADALRLLEHRLAG